MGSGSIKDKRIVDLSNLNLDQIKLLNTISIKLIDEFNLLSEKIFEATNGSMVWLFSSVLSRHNYQSKLFLHCCYLVLIQDIVSKNKNVYKFIVPSIGLKKVLEDIFKDKNIKIVCGTKTTIKTRLKVNLRHIIGPLRNFLLCWNQYRSRDIQRRDRLLQAKSATILDTFILSNSVNEGKYIDRYYPGLIDNLPENERKSIFFLPTIIGKYTSKDLWNIYKNSQVNIVFKQDYLKFIDFLSAIISMMRYGRFNSKTIIFRNSNIYPLLKDDLINKQYNNSTLLGILNYRFFKRLKNENVKLKVVVDWFENQPIDKGFNLGVYTFYPKAKHLGYKGYIISEDYNFYINPTDFEVKNHIIPDEIMVVGKGLVELSKKFCKDQKVNIAPAFRFNGQWTQNNIKLKNNKKQIVLVALPIAFKESAEIVKLLIDANNKKNIDADFHLKPHPSLNFELVKKSFKNKWPINFKSVSGDFNKRLMESNVLLGNTSSTCLESLARGVPVIVIGSQSNLTQNPIPENISPKIWKLAYTSDELSDYLNAFLNFSQKNSMKFMK